MIFNPNAHADVVDTSQFTAADPAQNAGALWYVLHVKSRQEKALAQNLAAMGLRCFLPLVQSISYHGKRKMEVELPLFPGYVFLNGSIEQAYDADRTRRVANIIHVKDQVRLDRELTDISIALSRQAPLTPCAFLKVGILVEVKSGPFRGIRGQIERISKNARLLLQIHTLGKAACIEIDGALVEPVEPSPADERRPQEMAMSRI